MQGKISNVKDKPVKAWKRILEVEKIQKFPPIIFVYNFEGGRRAAQFSQKKNQNTKTSRKFEIDAMETIKQPWLTKSEVFEGKPKVVAIETFDQKVDFDRENGQTSLDQLDMFKTKEAELMLNILSDFNSHLIVTLGDDQLNRDDAEKYLKLFREYQKKKEIRLKKDVEHQLKLSAEKIKKWKAKVSNVKDKPVKARKRILDDISNSSPKTKKENREPIESPKKKFKRDILDDKKVKKIVEDISSEKCQICHKDFDNVEEHQLRDHFKDDILNEYPSRSYKCHFKHCPFVTIPNSFNYLKHIGLEHGILAKLLDKDQSTPVKFKFNCPKCSMKDISDPRMHLSKHYVNQVKEDFPLVKDGNMFICPLANCPKQCAKQADLIHHINLEHNQINTYLQNDNLQHVLKQSKK